jgi:hypothetical protein
MVLQSNRNFSVDVWGHILTTICNKPFCVLSMLFPLCWKKRRGNMSIVQAFVAHQNAGSYIATKSTLIGLIRSIDGRLGVIIGGSKSM